MSGSLKDVLERLPTDTNNYGVAGAGYEAVEFQLRRALARGGIAPIIVNVDYGWWRMEGYGDKAYYIPSARHPDVQRLMGEDYSFTHSLPLIRYFGMFDRYWRRRSDQRDEVKRISPAAFAHFVSRLQQNPPDHTPNAVLLDRLLKLVDEHSDRLFIFVIAPYHPIYMKTAVHPETADAWLHTLDDRPNALVVEIGRISPSRMHCGGQTHNPRSLSGPRDHRSSSVV